MSVISGQAPLTIRIPLTLELVWNGDDDAPAGGLDLADLVAAIGKIIELSSAREAIETGLDGAGRFGTPIVMLDPSEPAEVVPQPS